MPSTRAADRSVVRAHLLAQDFALQDERAVDDDVLVAREARAGSRRRRRARRRARPGASRSCPGLALRRTRTAGRRWSGGARAARRSARAAVARRRAPRMRARRAHAGPQRAVRVGQHDARVAHVALGIDHRPTLSTLPVEDAARDTQRACTRTSSPTWTRARSRSYTSTTSQTLFGLADDDERVGRAHGLPHARVDLEHGARDRRDRARRVAPPPAAARAPSARSRRAPARQLESRLRALGLRGEHRAVRRSRRSRACASRVELGLGLLRRAPSRRGSRRARARPRRSRA